MMLEIKEMQEKESSVVSLSGRLDAVAAPDLEEKLHVMLDEGKTRVVMDLAALDFVASAGLRVFLAFAKLVRKQGGNLAFCGLNPDVMGVFEMTGFTSIFFIVDSREAALEELNQPST